MSVNNEGKIYLSAVLNPDSIKGLGDQIEGAAEQVSKKIKLKIGFDNKSIRDAAEESINKINQLFSKGNFGKLRINFNDVLPQFKDYLESSDVDDISKLNTIKAFEESLQRLKDFSKIDSFYLEGLDDSQLRLFIQDLNTIYDLTSGLDKKLQTSFRLLFG